MTHSLRHGSCCQSPLGSNTPHSGNTALQCCSVSVGLAPISPANKESASAASDHHIPASRDVRNLARRHGLLLGTMGNSPRYAL